MAKNKKDLKRMNKLLPYIISGNFIKGSIQELGVEQEISGRTTVEFDARKTGSFEFSCSSCEDWRGMVGTLVVE